MRIQQWNQPYPLPPVHQSSPNRHQDYYILSKCTQRRHRLNCLKLCHSFKESENRSYYHLLYQSWFSSNITNNYGLRPMLYISLRKWGISEVKHLKSSPTARYIKTMNPWRSFLMNTNGQGSCTEKGIQQTSLHKGRKGANRKFNQCPKRFLLTA